MIYLIYSNNYFTVIVCGQNCSIYLDKINANKSWNIVAYNDNANNTSAPIAQFKMQCQYVDNIGISYNNFNLYLKSRLNIIYII